MRPELKSRYTAEVIAQLQGAFGASAGKLLSDWHAETYLCDGPRGSFVLRVSHSAHRSRMHVEAELAWMRELSRAGFHVPVPLPSLRGNFVETPMADAEFSGAAFSLLRGREIGPDDWQPALFRRWGRLVGRLHRHSIEHPPAHRRPAWFESDFLNVERYIPDSERAVKKNAREIIAQLRAAVPAPGSYGLIHGDVYQENLRLRPDGELELFDFDNCEYGWLISDIAVALYASLWRVRDYEQRPQFARRFLAAFLDGYESEHHLAADEFSRLGEFLRLRDVLIYTVACKQLDRAHLTPLQARLMEEHRQRISAGTLIVEL
jgi:Ser/Thr protein kinase RdoA (MazF antagonist)